MQEMQEILPLSVYLCFLSLSSYHRLVVTKTRNDPQRSHNDLQMTEDDLKTTHNDPTTKETTQEKNIKNLTFEFFPKIEKHTE